MDCFQTSNDDSSSDFPSTEGVCMGVSKHENEAELQRVITLRGFNPLYPNLEH